MKFDNCVSISITLTDVCFVNTRYNFIYYMIFGGVDGLQENA
jgi:hypothetical protein